MYRQANQQADLHSLEQNLNKLHLILDLVQVHLAVVHLVVAHLDLQVGLVQRPRPRLGPDQADLVL